MPVSIALRTPHPEGIPAWCRDYQANPNIAVVSAFMCAESDAEAIRRSEGWTFFQFALTFYAKQGPVAPGSIDLWTEYMKWKESPAGRGPKQTGLIGSPETIRERLRKFESSGVDQVILLNQAGNNTHAHICESLELFAREVMPEFHAREAEHMEWKAGVLRGDVQLDEIDTDPFNVAGRAKPTKPPTSQATESHS